MKSLKFSYLILFLFFACKKQIDPEPSIIGKWQGVYQKGFFKNSITFNLNSKISGLTFEFDKLGNFNEYQTLLVQGKDSNIITNTFPYKISKDSLIFTKLVDQRIKSITFSYYYKYNIAGDTLTLIENLELSNKNTENQFIATSFPYILTPEIIKRFGRKYEDYYLEMKFIKKK